jgi:hypothetical protein
MGCIASSPFPLLQLLLGLILICHIIFFHENTRKVDVVVVNENRTGGDLIQWKPPLDDGCRMCEDTLANDVEWTSSSWTMPAIMDKKCQFPIRNENEASVHEDIRERFRRLSNRKEKDSILFIGNSVSRRQMYAVAHILGGEKAKVNEIAKNATLVERYGFQRVFDSKTKYHNAFEVEVNLVSGEMGEQKTCLPEHIENIAEEILKEEQKGESMRCSKTQLQKNDDTLRLGFFYVGSGSKAHKAMLKALDVWIEGAKNRRVEYALDTYTTIVIQVGLDSSALRMRDGYSDMLEKVEELISLRKGLRVIFSGVHHHFINANHDDFEYQEELREFLQTSLWPSIRKIKKAEILDTTKSTIEGVGVGALEHEPGSSWHFVDKGRIFLSSLLINHLLRSCRIASVI